MSPLVSIMKKCKTGGPGELFNASGLVLTAEFECGVEIFKGWKSGMERRDLKITLGKRMLVVTGKEAKTSVQ